MEGRANRTGEPLPHQVIFTVTDLTKVVHGVRTIVLWDQDINDGVLVESELAFHAQDSAGNVWVLGEYPEEYVGGQFDGAPSTWFSGQANAVGGTLVVGNPQVGAPKFLQAYAPPDIINDCGQVSKVGTQNPPLCVPVGCFDNVLVIDETSPPEPGTQQKYYAPGVGNFQVGALNDPEGETLVLKQKVQLSLQGCVAARNAALALEQHAYQVSPNLYGNTAPMEQTGACESTAPTATPTTSPPTSPTATPPAGPTATPLTAPGLSLYVPFIAKNLPPNPPPAIYDGCQSDPDQAGAANFPVRIVSVNKVAETVTLQNISDKTVSLEDWNLCSLATNRDHDEIFGTIAPGQTRTFSNIGSGPVWNDSTRNDAALYNAGGFLVSYWADQ
jgi:hypothetical protein